MTPAGNPASIDNSANFKAVRDDISVGFITTVLPAAKHAAIFHDNIING